MPFEDSTKTLRQFQLRPRRFSGQPVCIRFGTGASFERVYLEECRAMGLPPGDTIKSTVAIEMPAEKVSFASDGEIAGELEFELPPTDEDWTVFTAGKVAERLLEVPEGKRVAARGKLKYVIVTTDEDEYELEGIILLELLGEEIEPPPVEAAIHQGKASTAE